MIFTLIMYRESGETYGCQCCGPIDSWDSEFKFFQTKSPDELINEIVKFYDEFGDPDSLIITVDGEKVYCNDFGFVRYIDTFLSEEAINEESEVKSILEDGHEKACKIVDASLKEAISIHKEKQETKRLQRLAAEEEEKNRKMAEHIEYKRQQFEKLKKEFGE